MSAPLNLINLYYFTGTEFKSTACPVRGVMRFMEVQRGKEGMKSQQFNREVGATAGCTLRLLLNTIPPQMGGVKHGIRGDAWFRSIRTANEVALHGHEAVFQMKQYHASFQKEYIEEALKDAPGGVHILLEGTTENEVPLLALGYRYSRKTVLHFVLTKNAGSSKPGMPYQMRYIDLPNFLVCLLLGHSLCWNGFGMKNIVMANETAPRKEEIESIQPTEQTTQRPQCVNDVLRSTPRIPSFPLAIPNSMVKYWCSMIYII
jgi:hypothetical protein